MVNTCFVWQRAFVWQGAFSRNQRNAPATLIAANVGDQIQGQQMVVYAQGSDPRYAK